MNPAMAILIGVGVVLLVLVGWWVAVYNRLVRLRQHQREAWADIDVELKRRHDLIPNLVATVKGYAAHERETLAEVIRLRDRAAADTEPASAGADETKLQRKLKHLFALAEAYPDLKADAHFRELQQELALTEDRLAAARRFFNANVRELNSTIQTVPSSIVAGRHGFTTGEYFELADDAERVAPRVGM